LLAARFEKLPVKLANQISAGLNFAIRGGLYWNTNTGGFTDSAVSGNTYAEAFTRWFRLAPRFRSDSGCKGQLTANEAALGLAFCVRLSQITQPEFAGREDFGLQ
jgi:hypothetical protein